jgi:hypothetical protein
MTFRHRIGWLALAVLPMLLAGLFAIGMGFHMQFLSTQSHKPGAGWALMSLGLFTALMSLALLTMVCDVVIDRAASLVKRRLGCLGIVKVRNFPLKDFNRVRVFWVTVSGVRRYHVHLASPSDSVYLNEYTFPQQAIAKANEVGHYLGLPVVAEQ